MQIPISAVAFTHNIVCRILTFFTSACEHIIFLAALKLRNVLIKELSLVSQLYKLKFYK